jgi:hypothetical protein
MFLALRLKGQNYEIDETKLFLLYETLESRIGAATLLNYVPRSTCTQHDPTPGWDSLFRDSLARWHPKPEPGSTRSVLEIFLVVLFSAENGGNSIADSVFSVEDLLSMRLVSRRFYCHATKWFLRQLRSLTDCSPLEFFRRVQRCAFHQERSPSLFRLEVFIQGNDTDAVYTYHFSVNNRPKRGWFRRYTHWLGIDRLSTSFGWRIQFQLEKAAGMITNLAVAHYDVGGKLHGPCYIFSHPMLRSENIESHELPRIRTEYCHGVPHGLDEYTEDCRNGANQTPWVCASVDHGTKCGFAVTLASRWRGFPVSDERSRDVKSLVDDIELSVRDYRNTNYPYHRGFSRNMPPRKVLELCWDKSLKSPAAEIRLRTTFTEDKGRVTTFEKHEPIFENDDDNDDEMNDEDDDEEEDEEMNDDDDDDDEKETYISYDHYRTPELSPASGQEYTAVP